MKKKLFWCNGGWMDKDLYVKTRTKQLQDNIEIQKKEIEYYEEQIRKNKEYIERCEVAIKHLPETTGW